MNILSLYSKTHQQIKNDQHLLSEIKKLVSDGCNTDSNKYLCTGLKIGNIYLGLDFIKKHIANFSKIYGNTLFIDNISYEKADFSRVLLKVYLKNEHIANLTEDVSENGKYKIYDKGVDWGPYENYIKHFYRDPNSRRAVFIVHKEDILESALFNEERDRLSENKIISIRTPIIDLDHFSHDLPGGYPNSEGPPDMPTLMRLELY